jgi:hypothetical protein
MSYAVIGALPRNLASFGKSGFWPAEAPKLGLFGKIAIVARFQRVRGRPPETLITYEMAPAGRHFK